jgi:hypothetical protein
VEKLKVRWPGGRITEIEGPPLDRILRVEEPPLE